MSTKGCPSGYERLATNRYDFSPDDILQYATVAMVTGFAEW